jgi:hypothetical protein
MKQAQAVNAKPKAKTKTAKRATKAKSPSATAPESSASHLIDERIHELGDWRGETLARMRKLILECDPEMIEEWKWMGTPVWSCHGIVWKGTRVARSTFTRAKRSTPARSRRS